MKNAAFAYCGPFGLSMASQAETGEEAGFVLVAPFENSLHTLAETFHSTGESHNYKLRR